MSSRTPTNLPKDLPDDLAATAGRLLDVVRSSAPLVQALTNSVVTGFTANVLLAVGAAPAMVDIPEEAGPFAQVAGGVLVNLGTPHAEQRDAMREAVTAARQAGTPWVLDPVAVGALPVRTRLAADLLAQRPAVVRGNASEILALAGHGAGGRGVDATDGPQAALGAATEIARTRGAVVAVSGPVDLVTDGQRVVRCENGTALLTQVTGGGCALGAVMAAFLAAQRSLSAEDDGAGDRLAATVAAVGAYALAAERAAVGAAGPGDFAVRLLDSLAALTGADVATAVRLA